MWQNKVIRIIISSLTPRCILKRRPMFCVMDLGISYYTPKQKIVTRVGSSQLSFKLL